MQFASVTAGLFIPVSALLFSISVLAQQPGPFTAQDFQFSGPANAPIPPGLYGPDLDGGPDELTLSLGAVQQRLKRLGFHSFSEPRFRNGYWNIAAFHGNKKRLLRVHPHTGVIQSDRPYCGNCRYQMSEEF